MHIGPSELITGLIIFALLVWVAKIVDTSGGFNTRLHILSRW